LPDCRARDRIDARPIDADDDFGVEPAAGERLVDRLDARVVDRTFPRGGVQRISTPRTGHARHRWIESKLEHELDGARVGRPRFIGQRSTIDGSEPFDDSGSCGDDRARRGLVADMTRNSSVPPPERGRSRSRRACGQSRAAWLTGGRTGTDLVPQYLKTGLQSIAAMSPMQQCEYGGVFGQHDSAR
jgi:hypothetical protein